MLNFILNSDLYFFDWICVCNLLIFFEFEKNKNLCWINEIKKGIITVLVLSINKVKNFIN